MKQSGASYRLFKSDYVHCEARGWLRSGRRKLLHCLVNSGPKIFLPTLLTNTRRNIFNNLELSSPAKINLNLFLNHPAFTKVTFRQHGVPPSFPFSDRPPALPGLA